VGGSSAPCSRRSRWSDWPEARPVAVPLVRNLLVFIGVALAAVLVIAWTDNFLPPREALTLGSFAGVTITTNVIQWLAIAIGAYCSFSWFNRSASETGRPPR
jgi:hypothetical protein